MREIEFRGRGTVDKRWQYGYLAGRVYRGGKDNTPQMCIACGKPDHMGFMFVDPETVGEWTGRCDCNDTRIFEGDEVTLPEWYDRGLGLAGSMYTVVEWDNDAGGFVFRCDDGSCFPFGKYRPAEVEVVGNVHDREE
jgi:hypothetical protein